MPEKEHLASAALHCERSSSGQHRAMLRPGPATQHEGRRLQTEPASAQDRKIQTRAIFYWHLHYYGWILFEVLKTSWRFIIIRHWKYEYFAQVPRLGHCWPVTDQVPFLIMNSLSDHIQLERAWFMLSVLGSSLSSYKNVYKHVLTAPHLLQSSIWFTAVHKSQEQRAPGSAQSPPPAQGGTLGCAPTEPVSCAPTIAVISLSKAVVLLRYDLPCINSIINWFFWPSSRLFESLSEYGRQEEKLQELEMHGLSWVMAGPAHCLSSRLEQHQPFQSQQGPPPAHRDASFTSNSPTISFAGFFITFKWIPSDPINPNTSSLSKQLFPHHFLPLSFPFLSWQEHHVPFLWFHTTAVSHPSTETLYFQNLS